MSLQPCHRGRDELQVLLERYLQDPGDLEVPALAEDGHVLHTRLEEAGQVAVLVAGHPVAPRGAERDDSGIRKMTGRKTLEERQVLDVAAGVARLDVRHSKCVQLIDDPELVLDGEAQALPLAAVAQRGVEDLYHTPCHQSTDLSVWSISMSFSKLMLLALAPLAMLPPLPPSILFTAARVESMLASITSVLTPRPR